MAVSATLVSQLEQLTAPEKAAVADALWRQLDAQWQPIEVPLAEFDRRAAEAETNPDSTLSIGEEIRRLLIRELAEESE